eukprot:SAG31_NODE_44505_length_262_cov_0.957055_1_plen_67_part_01
MNHVARVPVAGARVSPAAATACSIAAAPLDAVVVGERRLAQSMPLLDITFAKGGGFEIRSTWTRTLD